VQFFKLEDPSALMLHVIDF